MTIFELGLWQFCFWWVAGLAFTAMAWVYSADEKRKLWHDEYVKWWLWHWFTGGALEPEKLYKRTEPLDTYLARRALLGLARASLPAAFVAVIYVADTPAESELGALLAWSYGTTIGLAASAYLVTWLACRRALSVWWGQPLFDALAKYIGWPPEMRWRDALHFDRVYELGLALTVLVEPSVDMEEAHITKVANRVRAKLGKDIRHVPDWIGQASEIRFEPEVHIPDSALFFNPKDMSEITNVRRLIESALATPKLLLGLAADGVPFWLDPDHDSPHFLISAGTGGGKTETLKLLAAQARAKGWRVFILDPKQLSHIWARNLPGIFIEDTAEGMHQLFLKLAATIDERARQCRGLTVHDELPDFERIVLVTEELSVLFDEQRAWWRAQGNKGEPPAVVALRKILMQGRFLKVHVFAGANRFDALPTGGGAARDQYAWVCLAEHSKAAVDMLAKGAPVEPKTAEDRRGRAQIVCGMDVTEIRRVAMTILDGRGEGRDDDRPLVAWLEAVAPDPLTDDETWRSRPRPPASALDSQPECEVGEPRTGAGPGRAVLDDPAPSSLVDEPVSVLTRTKTGPSYVTLRQVSADNGDGTIPLKQASLERASTRPAFPAPAEQGAIFKYEEAALVRWYWEERPRAPKRRTVYRPEVYVFCEGGIDFLRPGMAVKVGKSTNTTRTGRAKTFNADEREFIVHITSLDGDHPLTEEEMSALEAAKHEEYEAADLRIFGDREKFRVAGPLLEDLRGWLREAAATYRAKGDHTTAVAYLRAADRLMEVAA